MVISNQISSILKTIHYTLMYSDLMTVYRQCEVILDDGSVGYEKQEIYSNVPCKLSFDSQDKSLYDSIDINALSIGIKIFCDSILKIQKGDYIVCSRTVDSDTKYFQGLSNEPTKYFDGHQELLIVDTSENEIQNENSQPEGSEDDDFGGLF